MADVSHNGLPLLIGSPGTWSRNVPRTAPVVREKSVKPPSDEHVACWVYFIQAAGGGHVKIGTATRPDRRFSNLQTAHSQKLHFLGAVPGDASVERDWHNRFRRLHVRGEWFLPAAELLLAIEAAVAEV